MANSNLVQYTRYSPNHSGKRKSKIKKIVPHHTAGVISVVTLGAIFSNPARQASSNYGIGYDGKKALFVDEENESWCTSNRQIDTEAVTVELSNSAIGGQWPVSDIVLNAAIELFTDICLRNDIYPCTYTGDKSGTLHKHSWYAQTACPGPYLGSKYAYIAEEVTKRLTAIKFPPVEAKPAGKPRVLHTKVIDPKTVELYPFIKITKDVAELWSFDFDDYKDAKSVKQFKKGEELEVAAIVTNVLGSEYYVTPYSYKQGIRNGINVVDAKLEYKERT